MKNVYFVQPNNELSESVFLPYAIGTIAAYSFSREEINKEYRLCEFVFTKRKIEDLLEDMEKPYIVGFSNYMWSVEYNLDLASAIKEKWPECIIAFGGVQVPDDTEYLEEYPFIDLLMHGEGEEIFYNILMALSKQEDLGTVFNISYRKSGVPTQTEKNNGCALENFPSPYTMGLFDYIVDDPKNKNIQFDAIIETNRGCPYGCIYCCWAGNKSGFRQFSIERVKGDLEWMAKHGISFCFCCDSNFGILERDESIAEYIVELKKKYGYPQKFETTAAKNKDDLTFRINSKLDEVSLNRGISLAVQSMSPVVLEIIGRKNMSVKNFSAQVEKYRKSGMYTYTDLILGLPGETLESFCRGLFEVIEAGQHYSINVSRCEFLPNTKMYSKSFVEKYRLKTIKSLLCQIHSSVDNDMKYASRSEIVVETSTMSMAQWRKAQRISICVQGLHSLGLLRFFAIYLRKAKNLSYYDFYMNLYEWIENESTVVKRILDKVCASFDVFLKGEGNLFFWDPRFGRVYWEFYEGLFLCCAAELDGFYGEIKKYACRYFDDETLFEDLYLYQKNIIALPNRPSKEIKTVYDWQDYFDNMYDPDCSVPDKKATILKIAESQVDNWEDYARVKVWYGKRSGTTVNKAECIRQ